MNVYDERNTEPTGQEENKMTNKKTATATMKDLGYGVEIEMAGITREDTAKLIAKHFHTEGTVKHTGGAYDAWTAKDDKDRTWTVMYDSSIEDIRIRRSEMVTPILKYEDIETLQAIIRELRAAGAISNPAHDCGVHIHVTADDQTPETLRTLANLMAAHEDILKKAIGVTADRENWCRAVDPNFLKELNKRKPKTMSDLEEIWYGTQGGGNRWSHYDQSRYHILNLHSLFQGKGIEFRCFQFNNPGHKFKGGLHAGMIKAYIQISLAIVAQARIAKTASAKKPQTENQKYAMRCWLLRLGFIGDEYKTARDILTRRLDGNSAWRHGNEAA